MMSKVQDKQARNFMSKSKKTRKLKVGPKRRSRSAGKMNAAQKRATLQKAVHWPVMECLITEAWRETEALTQIAIARQSPTGYIVVAGFIVDLACLGVKNALTVGFASLSQYRQQYRNSLMDSQPMTTCSLDLAAKVINTGIDYAKSLGFSPHPDSQEALTLLQDAQPEACNEEVPVGGQNGKPFFIAGPYDDVEDVIATLEQHVGSGNYDYLMPIM